MLLGNPCHSQCLCDSFTLLWSWVPPFSRSHYHWKRILWPQASAGSHPYLEGRKERPGPDSFFPSLFLLSWVTLAFFLVLLSSCSPPRAHLWVLSPSQLLWEQEGHWNGQMFSLQVSQISWQGCLKDTLYWVKTSAFSKVSGLKHPCISWVGKEQRVSTD